MRKTLASSYSWAVVPYPLLAQKSPDAGIAVAHIDPFIGTGGHGHTHPAATTPFGMVQLGPDTRKEGWDGCSGYHYTDSTLYGFSHTHLSGTGVSDYSDILIRPLTGPEDLAETVGFDKASEVAEAGYYAVTLDNGIPCAFTASDRVGLHRYGMAWREDGKAYFLLDLGYRDRTLSDRVWIKHGEQGDYLSVYRQSEGWARDQRLYASIHFLGDFHIENIKGYGNGRYVLQVDIPRHHWTDSESKPHTARDRRCTQRCGRGRCGKQLFGMVPELAQKSHSPEEAFHWTKRQTQAAWQAELNRAQVTGGTDAQKRIYATALYHAFSVPNLWSDADGRYRGMDQKIYQDVEHPHYTVFSLWDTYRTAHPLYLLTQPERAMDFIETMLDHYDQSGRLPIWELAANETNCMIGYHSVSVIADAIAKGFPVDVDRALTAMIGTAESDVFGLPTYREQGYLSLQDESESVSKTLEYAYDDACIAWTAAKAGKDSIADHFWQRSQAWISLLDPETGLARPRDNGTFLKRYEPREVNNNFTEANAWQYSFSPIHDLKRWTGMLQDYGYSLEGQLDALLRRLPKL